MNIHNLVTYHIIMLKCLENYYLGQQILTIYVHKLYEVSKLINKKMKIFQKGFLSEEEFQNVKNKKLK